MIKSQYINDKGSLVCAKDNERIHIYIIAIDKQIESIEKSFGYPRYIYNYFLDKNKNYINNYNSIKEIQI